MKKRPPVLLISLGILVVLGLVTIAMHGAKADYLPGTAAGGTTVTLALMPYPSLGAKEVPDSVQVAGIDSSGRVAGTFTTSLPTAPGGFVNKGFFWDPKKQVTVWFPSATAITAMGDGEITGNGMDPATQTQGVFIWTPLSGMQYSHVLPSAFSSLSPSGELGLGGNERFAPYLFQQGTKTPLLPARSYMTGNDVNDTGTVVGTYQLSGGSTHAYTQSKSGTFKDLGALPALASYSSSSGEHINGSGNIIGTVNTESTQVHVSQPYELTGGTRLNILKNLSPTTSGALNAFDINDLNEIVGSSANAAVAWTSPTAVPLDLNKLAPAGTTVTLNRAQSLNNAGMIAGIGKPSGSTKNTEVFVMYGAVPAK